VAATRRRWSRIAHEVHSHSFANRWAIFFRLALRLSTKIAQPHSHPRKNKITIRGTVYDADHLPIPDAVLEFWSADGFARVPTKDDGTFTVSVDLPFVQSTTALHFEVLIFMRGLLKPVYTRVYLGNPEATASDAILKTCSASQSRHTLRSLRWIPETFCLEHRYAGRERDCFLRFVGYVLQPAASLAPLGLEIPNLPHDGHLIELISFARCRFVLA